MRGYLTLIGCWSREDDRVKLFDFRHIFIYFVDAGSYVFNLKDKNAYLTKKKKNKKHYKDSFFVATLT